jgi:hypothetical protein
VEILLDLNQLRGNPERIAGEADTAFQNGGNIQFRPDLFDGNVFILEKEGGSSGGYP